jgi:prepilin-type N-terminal cleavage/methylation domain-containing protein
MQDGELFMKTNRAKTKAAFTLVEIMIVVSIIAILATLMIVKIMRARDYARLNTIYTNLRTVETAKEQWALDNKKTTGDPVSDVSLLTNYFRMGALRDVVQEQYVPNAVGIASQADLPSSVGVGPYPPGSSIPAP